jgi:hypothetical protein
VDLGLEMAMGDQHFAAPSHQTWDSGG